MPVNRKQFPSELPIATWSSLTLTTHRVVRYGDATILVHKISGTRIVRIDEFLLLVLAFFVAVMGYLVAHEFDGKYYITILGALVAASLVGVYFARRETIVEIFCDDGRTLKCTITGAAELEHARKFADAVEQVACGTCPRLEAEVYFPETQSSARLTLEARPPSNR